jgi:hypothetical protein
MGREWSIGVAHATSLTIVLSSQCSWHKEDRALVHLDTQSGVLFSENNLDTIVAKDSFLPIFLQRHMRKLYYSVHMTKLHHKHVLMRIDTPG